MANDLRLNNVSLSSIVELLKVNDTRLSHPMNSKYGTDYVSTADGYSYSAFATYPYKINGINQSIPLKGTRPNFNKRYEIGNSSTTEDIMKYLIKYSDGSVWVSDGTGLGPEYNQLPSGTKIAEASEDLKVVFLELQGGGGGGCGSNLASKGAGGGGGGYLVVAIQLEHLAGTYWNQNSFPMIIGRGGAGVNGVNPAGSGVDTGLPFNGQGVSCTAYGGDGGYNRDTPGASRGQECIGVPFATQLFAKSGITGSTDASSTPMTATDIGQWAPTGEANTLQYPERRVIAGSSGPSCGGSSVLGLGGGADNNLNSIEGWGGAGAGRWYTLGQINTGGNGRGGYMAIYY